MCHMLKPCATDERRLVAAEDVEPGCEPAMLLLCALLLCACLAYLPIPLHDTRVRFYFIVAMYTHLHIAENEFNGCVGTLLLRITQLLPSSLPCDPMQLDMDTDSFGVSCFG